MQAIRIAGRATPCRVSVCTEDHVEDDEVTAVIVTGYTAKSAYHPAVGYGDSVEEAVDDFTDQMREVSLA